MDDALNLNERALDKLMARNGLGPPKPKRTEKQTAASRTNGQRSRGPVTLVGKHRASRNAVRVGLFCKTIPDYRYPLYYSKQELVDLSTDITDQMGCRTTFGKALAESLATDMLRLRHIRALEHALLDPDIERDHDLERALRQQPGQCVERSEADTTALLAALTKVRNAFDNGTAVALAIFELDLVVDELWKRVNAARRNLESARRELAAIDDQLKAVAPDDLDGLKEQRTSAEEYLQLAEAGLKTGDLPVYGIENKDDVLAVLTNTKVLPAEKREAWKHLASQAVYDLMAEIKQAQDHYLRIESMRRGHLLKTLDGTDKLNQLAEYGSRIQRHMEKTLAMLREVEELSVIDV